MTHRSDKLLMFPGGKAGATVVRGNAVHSARAQGTRGAALMVALVFVFALSAGAAVVWQSLHRHLDHSRIARNQEQAYWLAESGVYHAMAMLQSTGDVSGAQEVQLGGGVYQYEIQPGAAAGAYRVLGTGRTGEGLARVYESRVEGVLRRNQAGHYELVSLIRLREMP